MRYKRWCCGILILLLAVFGAIAAMNYFVDPLGYFTFQSGDYADIDFQADTSYYQRLLKLNHAENFSENYDAYLIGGSKAGSYQPEKLTELDGYRYYNMFELSGNLQEYAMVTDFLIEHANPKKIIISISGGEVRKEGLNFTDPVYQYPAMLTGDSVMKETLKFLFMDPNKTFKRIRERLAGKTYYEMENTGARNLVKSYTAFSEDPEEFTQKQVLKSFDKHMKTLFTKNKKLDYYQTTLDSLQQIKDSCDAAGVELMVIVAPAFIGEMSEHDSTYYWKYLENMATITDYWDFSGYHDIDLNPYNYYNEGHFYYEVAELIVDTITGKDSYPGFGAYVTRYNVAEHIDERAADYQKLKEEYNTTGTITLFGMEDASYLPKSR
ncbi:MAG: hypothetical protein PHE06_11225 [Lachnospiraceae bacterium]|nr:hypothetical protein [Lachnospiraceae bacterium]